VDDAMANPTTLLALQDRALWEATRILGDMSEAVATITGGQPDSAIMASRGNWIAAATPLSTPPLSDAETFQFPGCFLPVSIPALWFPPCFPGCFQVFRYKHGNLETHPIP
jgi:hypothetical protein